jgi:hypothetical protein
LDKLAGLPCPLVLTRIPKAGSLLPTRDPPLRMFAHIASHRIKWATNAPRHHQVFPRGHMESCREGAHNTRERLLRSRQGLLSANQGARSQGRKAPWGHTTPIVARRLAEAPGEGRGLSSRQTQYVVRDLEIGQPINSEECSETADGVTRESEGRRRARPRHSWNSSERDRPAGRGRQLRRPLASPQKIPGSRPAA